MHSGARPNWICGKSYVFKGKHSCKNCTGSSTPIEIIAITSAIPFVWRFDRYKSNSIGVATLTWKSIRFHACLMKIREELLHEISSIAPTFKEYKYFMSDEFTLVDCCFAPILWRLPSMGIKLPLNRHLKPLIDYQNSIFERPGFLDSLSSLERDLKSEE